MHKTSGIYCFFLFIILSTEYCNARDRVEVPELSPVEAQTLSRDRREPTVSPISSLVVSRISSTGFNTNWARPPAGSRVTAIHLRLQIVGGDITHEETLKRKVHYYKFKGLNPNTRYVLSLQTANKRGILSTPVSSEITTDRELLEGAAATEENVRRIIEGEPPVRFIDVCQKAKRTDLVILIDGSWSVGSAHFKKMQAFLVSLIKAFVVGPDHVLVGLAQYSDNPRMEFALGEHATNADVSRAINNTRYKGGNTATGLALTFLREVMFARDGGGRNDRDVRKTALVITDGESLLDDVPEPARLLREIGVEVFCIGVANALQSELEDIASDPDVDHVFSVQDFDHIDEIKDKLLKDVCKSVAVCPQPKPIANGQVRCNETDHLPGSNCSYTCNGPQYKLHNKHEADAGIAYRLCKKDGHWDKPQPYCDHSVCPFLRDPANGRYNCTKEFRIGSECTLKCDAGYKLSQELIPRCRKNARWSSQGPQCIQIICPDMSAISHGTVECDNENFHLSTCTFKCDEGYRINGLPTTECTEDDTWSRPAPTCAVITCSPLAPLAHGVTDCSDEANYASKCSFSCTEGYELKGSSEAVCDSQGWWNFNDAGDMPRCERITCNSLPETEHLTKDCSRGNYYGSVCIFTCDRGYDMLGAERTTCTGESSPGNWSSPAASCQLSSCPPLKSRPNGRIQCSDGGNYRSVCRLICEEGFELAGPSRSMCEASGSWSDGISSCQKITCHEAEKIQHGSVVCSDANYYKSECKYTCETGYELTSGTPERVCGLDRLFSGGAPTCTLIKCNLLVQPLNGVGSCTDGNNYGSICKYSCNTGFEIFGSPKRMCKDDGSWSGEETTCTLLECEPLSAPENADISCTPRDGFDGADGDSVSASYGTRCDITCREGYSIIGSKKRVCGKDETWSGEEAECVLIRCPSLPEPPHASMTCTQTNEFGSECLVECDIGYYLLEGSARRVCKKSKKWSGKDAVCNIKTCDNLVAKPHTTLSCTNGKRYGSICTAKPELGYRLRGPSVVECTEDGALDTPVADLISCASLGSPRDGYVKCTDNFDFASVCSYSCADGYDVSGPHSITCLPDGEWSDVEARCTVANCPKLTAPTNGAISCTEENHYQSTCTYSCEDGYQLSAGSPRTCKADHAWTGNNAVCTRIACEELDPPKYGDVSCSRGNDYHSDCTVHCNEGYDLKGSKVRSCGEDHAWTGAPSSCSMITCEELKSPRNGKKKCTDSNNYDSECSFVCEVGYEFSGSRSRVCGADRAWTGQDASCTMVTCSVLEAPQNGSVRCDDEDNYDSTCRFACDIGFDLHGSSRRTCEADGSWSRKQPSCSIVKCGKASAPQNGFVDCTMKDRYESVCKYRCRVGFDLIGSSMRVCESDHQWTGTQSSCELIRCRPLKAPQNGQITCTDGVRFGSICDYTCDAGYRLTGPEETGRLCTADHLWSGTQAYCEEITCDELAAPANAFVDCSRGFLYGSECTLVPKPGYSYNGPTHMTCRESGSWSAAVEIGNIRVVECLDLSAPENGSMECTAEFEFRSTCSFTCQIGYQLQGSPSRTCQETQDWTGEESHCERISCGAIGAPNNGRISCTAGDLYNSICTVACNPGFELSGSETRTCLHSQMWSRDAPTCNLMRCGMRDAPLHGTASCTNRDAYLSTCTYTCNVGHELIGDVLATCEEDGTWLGEVPSCELITCEELSNPENGQIKCTSGNEYNSLCRTICMAGHELVGSRSRICQGNGAFSGTPTECRLITCNAEDQLEHGEVNCGDGANYDSECAFTCEEGYHLIGSVTRRCLSSGYWSDTVPHCERIRCRNLRQPPNSNFSCSNRNLASSVCSVECETCHTLLGSGRRTCREDGSWTGEEPACVAITCPTLRTPLNGMKECDGGDHECGTTCRFTCKEGNELVGSRERSCEESGRWSGDATECIRNQCPTLVSLDEDLVMNCTDANRVGSNCSFSCRDSESNLVGSTNRICLKGGVWSNTDPVCRACKTAISDIIFVVDGSWSVGDQNFKKIKDFLKALVLPFKVGWDHTRFGVVQYSDDPRTEFLLTDHLTLNEVMSAIDAMPYKGGNTNTGRAITFSLYNALSLSSGARPFVRKTALILTDGRSQDDVGNPAREMRNAGMRVLVVGVGDADIDELKLMASPPHDTSVYHVKDYGSIKQIQSVLAAKLCEEDQPRPTGMCNCPPGPPGPPGVPGLPGTSISPGETMKGAKGDPFAVIHINYEDQLIEARSSDGTTTSLNLPDGLQAMRSDDGSRAFFPIKGESGHPGMPGTKGEPGSRGANGNPGIPGDMGLEGSPGARGPEGPRGPPGFKGMKGDSGSSAPQAVLDEQSIYARARRDAAEIVRQKINEVMLKLERDKRSRTRATVVEGPPGPPGPPGQRGYEGPVGPQGHPGVPGLRGAKGSKGDIGDAGPRGAPGHGFPGPAGPKGQPGPRGKSLLGKPGPMGPRGPPGKSKKKKPRPMEDINKF